MLFFNPGRFLEPPRQKSHKNAPQLTRHKQQGLSYLILPQTRLITNIQAKLLPNNVDIYISIHHALYNNSFTMLWFCIRIVIATIQKSPGRNPISIFPRLGPHQLGSHAMSRTGISHPVHVSSYAQNKHNLHLRKEEAEKKKRSLLPNTEHLKPRKRVNM